MARAIGIVFLFVVLGFTFVFSQLWLRKPTVTLEPSHTRPMYETQDDGSVYAVSLRLTQFERRLMEEEERFRKLQGNVEQLSGQRDELAAKVGDLQDEVRRLRKQLVEQEARLNAPKQPTEGPPATTVTPTEAN